MVGDVRHVSLLTHIILLCIVTSKPRLFSVCLAPHRPLLFHLFKHGNSCQVEDLLHEVDFGLLWYITTSFLSLVLFVLGLNPLEDLLYFCSPLNQLFFAPLLFFQHMHRYIYVA